jgi:ureidoglycolate lyase
MIIDTLEQHPHSAQIFLPLDVARYLIVVAPSDELGNPDLAHSEAFLAPGNVGIVYRPGVWHAGAAVLDRPGSFGVLMWRNDTADDEVFRQLSTSLRVHL